MIFYSFFLILKYFLIEINLKKLKTYTNFGVSTKLDHYSDIIQILRNFKGARYFHF